MESIDVEKIMEEIRQEISEKGYTSAMLSFQDVEEEVAENKTMEEYCDLLNTTWEIQAYRLLPQNGVMDRLKV